jgi:hypothetical protein
MTESNGWKYRPGTAATTRSEVDGEQRMLDVAHRPVYGSSEIDEIICSCGWHGPTFALPEHYEKVARDARESLESFVAFMEIESIENDWGTLDGLEAKAGYLSPAQFLIAVRNQGFTSRDS